MRRLACRGLIRSAALLLASVLASPVASLANDSSAELSVGGLVFTRNPDVSIEQENLTITPETVTVRYRFVNQSDKPVTLTIAFPLPDVDLAEAETYAFPIDDPVNFVGFRTSVDGRPVTFDIRQQAFLGDKDVTEAVKAAGLPFLPLGPYDERLEKLSPSVRDKLVNDGLLVATGTDQSGHTVFDAVWTTKTSVVRRQTFPARQAVTVEHRYLTSLGISFDTLLRKGLRDNKVFEAEVKRYRDEYCIRDDLLRGVDRLAGPSEANTAKLRESRISYVLKTGANWAGPIKDFTVTIDKGKPNRLVSFCLDDVKKISPTAFQVKVKDFTPTRDLKILLIGLNE